MRTIPNLAPALVVAMLLAMTANAQERLTAVQRDARMAQEMKRVALEQRAYELRPRRRDTPLRYLNISDNEMREIQQVAEKILSKTMLNVSPVVEGCACEEGLMCTDQIFVVTYAADKAGGLQLSRVKSHWQIGVVQQWWLRYDALRARLPKMDYREYLRAEGDLYREFPSCVGDLVPAASTIKK